MLTGRLLLLAGRALASSSHTLATTCQSVAAEAAPTSVQAALRCFANSWGISQKGFSTNSHDIFNVHKDSSENNQNTTFEWTPANLKRAQEIIARYPPNYKASAVIPVLDLAQQQNNGWLPLAALNAVAKLLEMPEMRVYEVATFYTMFNRSKMGKYHVMICGTTPCRLQGALKVQEALEKHLGIHIGETTKDGLFTLGEMECMGACVNAPMIAIADYSGGVEKFSYTYYEDLTPEDTVSIVETLKKGGTPKAGSQHRSKAEPAGCVAEGKWVPASGEVVQTLTGQPRGPFAPNLEAAAKA